MRSKNEEKKGLKRRQECNENQSILFVIRSINYINAYFFHALQIIEANFLLSLLSLLELF